MNTTVYLKLPRGSLMPAIGLGTWQLSDEIELTNALNTALKLGYRHIDTALIFDNEEIIGKVLKEWFETNKIKREELFITTKLPMYGMEADKVEEMIKLSLNNLKLNYVDLYLIQFPCYMLTTIDGTFKNMVTDHIAVWKKMEEQVEAGRAKNIGISNFNIQQIERLLKSKPKIKPVNLQVELHVFLQQQDLVRYCLKNEIIVTAFSPLGSPEFNKVAEQYRATKPLPDILHDPTIKKIAEKHKKTNAQIMLRHLFQRCIIVIPKSGNPAHLKENFNIFDFVLDSHDMEVLNGLDVGEIARVHDYILFEGADEHPEWPFPKI